MEKRSQTDRPLCSTAYISRRLETYQFSQLEKQFIFVHPQQLACTFMWLKKTWMIVYTPTVLKKLSILPSLKRVQQNSAHVHPM